MLRESRELPPDRRWSTAHGGRCWPGEKSPTFAPLLLPGRRSSLKRLLPLATSFQRSVISLERLDLGPETGDVVVCGVGWGGRGQDGERSPCGQMSGTSHEILLVTAGVTGRTRRPGRSAAYCERGGARDWYGAGVGRPALARIAATGGTPSAMTGRANGVAELPAVERTVENDRHCAQICAWMPLRSCGSSTWLEACSSAPTCATSSAAANAMSGNR